ncbi:sulfotransferase family protein [Vibrio fluvialis]|nr:sulfotransferase family protein [Vibrio fluvialis]
MKTVVILGMHRSGTSVVAKAVSLSGVEFGDNLLEAKADNEKGFWEDAYIVDCNDKVLHQSQHEWYTVGEINPVLKDEKANILQYIEKKFKGFDVWGVKDPRLCRLLPEWNNILDSVASDIKYCVAIRNPLNVIRSLESRNEFTAQHAELLWYQYNINILQSLINKEFSVIDFDQLITEPKTNVIRLAKGLSLEYNLLEEDLDQFCNEFVTANLRHSSLNFDDLLSDSSVHKDVKTLYKYMLDLTKNEKIILSKEDIADLIAESELLKEITNGQRIFNEEFRMCFSLKERLTHTEASLNITKQHLMTTLQERDQALNERDIVETRHQMALARLADLEHTKHEMNEKLIHIQSELETVYNSKFCKLIGYLRSIRRMLG